MAQIWEYIANYNPQGFYEDNRSKMLTNDIKSVQLNAANRENERQKKIWAIEDALANGDNSMLRAYGIYSPEKRGKLIENEEKMLEYARPLAEAYMQASPENKAKVYGQIYNRLKGVMDVSDMPVQWNEDVDGMMETIANSDPQKQRDLRVAEIQEQRDARLNEYTKERDEAQFGRDLQKMELAHQYAEQSAENNLNRDIRKLQFAYDRADQKTKEAADFISQAFTDGKISETDYITALGKTLGADISPKSAVEKMGEDYITGNMTPEQEQAYISRVNALTTAKSSSKAETPAQQMERLHKAGFTAESARQAVINGDASLLEPDTTPRGSLSANTQGNNAYSQWLEQNPNATPEEQRNARYQFGVPNFDDTNALNLGKIDAQNQGRLDIVDRQGQNAINLENTKQGNRVALADVNAQNAQDLENLKQQNRVGLAWINDEISKGKELRQLDNNKSLAEFKNSLPTAKMIELANTANYLRQNGFDVSADQLLAEEYKNALETAEIDRQYKQAQTEKALREQLTDFQKNTQWLVDNGAAKDINEAAAMLKSNNKSVGKAGDVVNGVTLTGYPAYDEAMLKKKAEEDAEDVKNKDFIQKQAKKLKPVLKAAYEAAKDGEGIGVISGKINTYVRSSKQASKNIAAINTLKNLAGPTMIAQLKAAGAGARSFDSEGERDAYLPKFEIYQSPDVLAQTIKQFADKMLDIKLED